MRHRWMAVGGFGLLLIFCMLTAALAEVKILVIPKGTAAVFWSNVASGARKAGSDLGASVTYRGPRSEDQHEAQSHLIAYGIRQEYDAIVLAPNHVTATTAVLKNAVAMGIKVVLIDSNMESRHHASFIESNNYAAGQKAADHIGALLGGAGTVALIRYQADSASTRERESGFSDACQKKFPHIRIVADPRGGTSIGEAYHTVSKILDQFPQIDAIFCVNEPMTMGSLKALAEKGLAGKIRFVGFDLNTAIRVAILNHQMDATIAQNPYQIGYLGVKTAVRLIQNQPVPEKIYTDTVLITAGNIDTEAVQQIVRSNLK